MRLFVTGASGLLGSNLCFAAAHAGHDVFAAYNEHAVRIGGCTCLKMDLRSSDLAAVKKLRPDCIIHCAALTNVDLCETEQGLAHKLNVEITETLAGMADALGAKFLFISSDSIFDGTRRFHKEDEAPSPLNYYARTKVEAEAIVRSHADHAIVRTNFYGFNLQDKQSFSEWLYSRFASNEKITAFTDFYFSPILANNLCAALLEIACGQFNGTLNVAGDCRLSKYEFAIKFAEIFGFEKRLVMETMMGEKTSLRATRPNDCSLDISMAKGVLKTKLLNTDDGIKEYKRLLNEGYPQRLRGL